MNKVITTIPEVPESLENASLREFLSAVKDQIEVREGSRQKAKVSEKFVTRNELEIYVDDEVKKLKRSIPSGSTKASVKPASKVNLSPLQSAIDELREDVNEIQNSQVLNIQLKEGVFVNTFIHVGPDVPSDAGWNPEGVGIHKHGIYGVGPETDDGQFGHFFIGSQDYTDDLGKLAPYLGERIWAGELRVGDDVQYVAQTDEAGDPLYVLQGNDYLWYRPGKGLQIQMLSGALTVGDHKTGTGTIQGQQGLFVLDEGKIVHGFSIIDDVDTGAGGTLNRNDAVIGDFFNGNGILWDASTGYLSIDVKDGGGLTVGNHETGTGLIVAETGLQFMDSGKMYFALSNVNSMDVGEGTIDRNDIMLGDYHNGKGILFDASENVIDYRGLALTMIEEHENIVQEGDSFTRLADRMVDHLVDGEYGRVKASALTADGLIVMDHVVDGEYGRIKASALTADGLVILDNVVEGEYGLLKSTHLQAGKLKLTSETIKDDNHFISSTYIDSGRIIISGVEGIEDYPTHSELSDALVDHVTYGELDSKGVKDALGLKSLAFLASADWAEHVTGVDFDWNKKKRELGWRDPPEGLYISQEYLGFWDGHNWKTYIDNNGLGLFRGHVGVINDSRYYPSLSAQVAVLGQHDNQIGVGGIGKWAVCGHCNGGKAAIWGYGINGALGLHIERGHTILQSLNVGGILEVTGDYLAASCPVGPAITNKWSCGTSVHRWYSVGTERISCTGESVVIGSSSKPFTLRFRAVGGSEWDTVEAYTY